MNARPCPLKVEALEARDAPVILIAVLPLLTLHEIKGITFVVASDPQHTQEVRVASPGAVVSVTLAPDDCPRCPR
jgi:hypothetical protein